MKNRAKIKTKIKNNSNIKKYKSEYENNDENQNYSNESKKNKKISKKKESIRESPEKNVDFTEKKPLNPFFYFCQIQTKKCKNKNLDIPTFKELVEKWKNLSSENMEKYKNKFLSLNKQKLNNDSKKTHKKSNSSTDIKNIIENHSISFDYSFNFKIDEKIRKSFSILTKNKHNKSLLKELKNNKDIKDIKINDDSICFKTKIKSTNKKYIFNHKKFDKSSDLKYKENKKK